MSGKIHQLTVIMFTDVVGYTALMDADEDKAFQVLVKNRSIQRPIIKKHNGKWLKEMGDGVLARFKTASDAVYCAQEIQRICALEPDLSLRIGIHLGEVIVQNDDVFGSGVNIASRLEEQAPAGGIYVSESVYRNVSNKKGIDTRLVKEAMLKHVKDPVKIYEVLVEKAQIPGTTTLQPISHRRGGRVKKGVLAGGGIIFLLFVAFAIYQYGLKDSASTPQTMAEEEVERSIAVLPFDNFSQEKEENQYLCDGFMEEILNHLSRIRSLQVRSRSSVEQYRENRPTLPEIGEKMGVSHVLEGSVQKIEDEMKVVVQLILAKEDRHIWQNSYREKVADIFQLQSQIAKNIADELEIQLTPLEEISIEKPPTENLIAYDYYLRAVQYNHNWGFSRNRSDYENAVLLYRKAEREESTFALPLVGRAKLFWQAAVLSTFLSQEIDIDSILILCNQAITADPNLASAYYVRGRYYDHLLNEIDKAKADYEKAVDLDPNSHNFDLGRFYFDSKNYIQGLQLMHKGEKLSFGDPGLVWLYHMLGYKYLELGDTEKTRQYWDQIRSIRPDFGYGSEIELALCLGEWNVAYELIQAQHSLRPSNREASELLGTYFLHTKNYKEALRYFDEASDKKYEDRGIDEGLTNLRFHNGIALWLNGREVEGGKLIRECLSDYIKVDRLFVHDREVRIAGIYAFLGNKKEAYYWLRKSKWKTTALYEVNQDIWFSNINQEVEFHAIVNSIKEERRMIREEIARLKATGKWELE